MNRFAQQKFSANGFTLLAATGIVANGGGGGGGGGAETL